MKTAALILLALAVTAPAAASTGKSLYGRNCLRCHGMNGVGTAVAPSLRGVGARAADFYLSTGYMPLQHIGLQPRRSRLVLNPSQIKALTGYVASLAPGPAIPTPGPGSVSQGFHLFTDHCAGCHQVVAEGGYGTGAVPPPLEGGTPTQVAEAVRIGPYVMPTFSPKAISNAQLDSIIAYVQYAKHPDDRGGWAIGHVGPVPEGLISWLIAAAAPVVVCMLIGTRLGREN